MTLATATVDLGDGWTAAWVWQQGVERETGIPVGAILRHPAPSGGTCQLYVSWATDDIAVTEPEDCWLMESLVPLSLEEGVVCPACDVAGTIVAGAFLPLEHDDEGGGG